MRKASHTKPQIISAIKATARRLKRTPTRSEFERLTGIHWMKVQRLFGGYRVAVREAGLEPDPGGIRIDTAAMLEDFGRLARRLKRHPTREEYEKLGRYASASLENGFTGGARYGRASWSLWRGTGWSASGAMWRRG